MKPGSAEVAGRVALVTVSPTSAAFSSLIPAVMNPTSPAASSSRAAERGVNTPTCSHWYAAPDAISRILSRGFSVPCITRTSITTPT